MTENETPAASVESIEDAIKILGDDLGRDPEGYTEADLDGKPTDEQIQEIVQVILDGLCLKATLAYAYNPDKACWQVGVVKTESSAI